MIECPNCHMINTDDVTICQRCLQRLVEAPAAQVAPTPPPIAQPAPQVAQPPVSESPAAPQQAVSEDNEKGQISTTVATIVIIVVIAAIGGIYYKIRQNSGPKPQGQFQGNETPTPGL